MNKILLNCSKNHKQYKIVAECNSTKTILALAGFCAEEQAENILYRHLQNLCLQSDGSLCSTHTLICSTMQQWQSTLNIPAVQVLNYINQHYIKEQLYALCLYKTNAGGEEKLINRILL
ncbi:MAG: hypothetical protein JST94_06875 [Bacteroidetes bacterium]|nr:hypothetical protein [Bacteroidota bacterium]MBS1591607.1 hypothetical protein [Bacteroidota bacterium]MBS1639467.1 hypothetical protein [Bacteroidota bacterium]MBS1641764.1 hypothetical protein [Bacteroidota bacterium]MBS1671160.1 hypothetical protein [Bacteroidota bacterium]